MIRWGKTNQGKVRWRCPDCHTTSIRTRTDARERMWRRRFLLWITGSYRLSDLADRWKTSISTIRRCFHPFLKQVPVPTDTRLDPFLPFIVDALSVCGREGVLLIGRTGRRVVMWHADQRENHASWRAFFAPLMCRSLAIVCDGQRGLFKAISERFPDVPVQRCVIHVHRQAMAWITQHPKTLAGVEMKEIVSQLLRVKTATDAEQWTFDFQRWCMRFDAFLKERTHHDESCRWWYTHRKLRAVRSLLKNSLSHLFLYVHDPRIPRTSNHVEGGINARIKDLFRVHRGISFATKYKLAAWYLSLRHRC